MTATSSIHQTETAVAQARRLGDAEGLLRALGAAAQDVASRPARLRDVTDVLRETRSSVVRNAAALALVDMDAKEASASIVDVLRRSEIAEAAGTLLYALDELGASIPLDVLVSLIAHGSYEARAEALTFLRDGRIDAFDHAMRRDAELALSRLAEDGDDEIAGAAELALEFLGRNA